MEKKTVRHFSLLGVVLMGVSAITAAFVSSKSQTDQSNSINNGTLRLYSGDEFNHYPALVISCITKVDRANCHKTTDSGTTGDDLYGTLFIDADMNVYTTYNYTSRSLTLSGFDTTSELHLL